MTTDPVALAIREARDLVCAVCGLETGVFYDRVVRGLVIRCAHHPGAVLQRRAWQEDSGHLVRRAPAEPRPRRAMQEPDGDADRRRQLERDLFG